MNGIAAGTVISYTLAPWEKIYLALDGLAIIFLLWVIGMIIYRWKDKKKNQDKYKTTILSFMFHDKG